MSRLNCKSCSLLVYTVITASFAITQGRISVFTESQDELIFSSDTSPVYFNMKSYPQPELTGYIIDSSPPDACQVPLPPPTVIKNVDTQESNNDNATLSYSEADINNTAWILLVTWDGDTTIFSKVDCSLVVKASHAQTAGYSAIIFQDLSSNYTCPPVGPWESPMNDIRTDINIPGFAVEDSLGQNLRENFTYPKGFIVQVGPNDKSWISNWIVYLLIAVLVIATVFVTLGTAYVAIHLIVMIVFWIRESIVSRIQRNREERRRRLPASKLKRLPTQLWTTDMSSQDTCSICLETFVESDRVRILPCSHVFHMICIDPWLLRERRKCPNCKARIKFSDDSNSETSSDDEQTPLLRSSNQPQSNPSINRLRFAVPSFSNDDEEQRSRDRLQTINRILQEAVVLVHQEVTRSSSTGTSQTSSQVNSQNLEGGSYCPPPPPSSLVTGSCMNNTPLIFSVIDEEEEEKEQSQQSDSTTLSVIATERSEDLDMDGDESFSPRV